MKEKSIQPTDRRPLLESLYSFHFRDTISRMIIYALTAVLALAYALINDLVLGRPERNVVIECAALTVILLVGLSLAYSTNFVNRLIAYFRSDTDSLMQLVFIRAVMAIFIVGAVVRIVEIMKAGAGQPPNPFLNAVSDKILNNLLPFLGLILSMYAYKAYSRSHSGVEDQPTTSSQKNTP